MRDDVDQVGERLSATSLTNEQFHWKMSRTGARVPLIERRWMHRDQLLPLAHWYEHHYSRRTLACMLTAPALGILQSQTFRHVDESLPSSIPRVAWKMSRSVGHGP
jgi:hypothetical protein